MGTFGGFLRSILGTFLALLVSLGRILKQIFSKREEGISVSSLWARKVAPRRPGKAPNLRPRGFQEATKRALERKTSKSSNMVTLSMKIFDFEGLEGFENHQIQVQNNFKNKKKSMRSANVVAKKLRKPLWPENCARVGLALMPSGYFEAGLPPHLLSKREIQRTRPKNEVR